MPQRQSGRSSVPVPAIDVHDVVKRYRTQGLRKTVLALDHVSLLIPKGSVFGFLGPNGAGKTTLIKILVGIMSADSGTCAINGQDTQSREAKLSLGYLPERPYFHDFLDAEEFLRFHGKLWGMSDDQLADRIPKLLDRLDLKRATNRRLRNFSKGMLQRVGFAQALIHDPDVLILDEPMSGLDPVGRRELRDIITGIAETGKTIFFSTHIIHDVEVICSSVGFISAGKLKGSGNIDDLLGKTVKSMEIRFSLPASKDAQKIRTLKSARRTMDGWVLDIEGDADALEDQVTKTLAAVLDEKGQVRAVVPRKSTLEDLFFGEPS